MSIRLVHCLFIEGTQEQEKKQSEMLRHRGDNDKNDKQQHQDEKI